MRGGVSLQTRRELLQYLLPQYRKASPVEKKSKLLDAFAATTGYHRKYAMWLLNHAKEGQSTPDLDPLLWICRNFRAAIKRRSRRAGVTAQNCPAHT